MKTEQQIKNEIEALKITRAKLNDYDWDKIINDQIYVLEHRMNYASTLNEFKHKVPGRTPILILYSSRWLYEKLSKTDIIDTIQQIKHQEIIDMLDVEIDALTWFEDEDTFSKE